MTVDTTLTENDKADILSIFGVDVSDVQDSVYVSGNSVVGVSKYLSNVNTFDMTKGHHFVVLHFASEDADKIEVSMDPTQSGLTELDESGVIILQMKDDQSQTIKAVVTKDGEEYTTNYAISGMIFASN